MTKPKEPRGRVGFRSDDERALPLASLALDLMKERGKVRRLDTDLVFPGRPPRVGKGIAPIDQALGRNSSPGGATQLLVCPLPTPAATPRVSTV